MPSKANNCLPEVVRHWTPRLVWSWLSFPLQNPALGTTKWLTEGIGPICMYYKSLSWVLGLDRKNLSRGLLSGIMRLAEWVKTDPKGWTFLSVPHNHDGFFFLHTFHFWKWVFDNAVTSIADARHTVMTLPWRLLTSLRTVTSTLTMAYHYVLYNQYISNTWKFSFIFPMGWIRMCEIRFAITGVICAILIRYARKDVFIL